MKGAWSLDRARRVWERSRRSIIIPTGQATSSGGGRERDGQVDANDPLSNGVEAISLVGRVMLPIHVKRLWDPGTQSVEAITRSRV